MAASHGTGKLAGSPRPARQQLLAALTPPHTAVARGAGLGRRQSPPAPKPPGPAPSLRPRPLVPTRTRRLPTPSHRSPRPTAFGSARQVGDWGEGELALSPGGHGVLPARWEALCAGAAGKIVVVAVIGCGEGQFRGLGSAAQECARSDCWRGAGVCVQRLLAAARSAQTAQGHRRGRKRREKVKP